MAEDGIRTPGPFDPLTIKRLVRLMARHDLAEIDLREGDLRIRVRRGPHGMIGPEVSMMGGPVAQVPVPTATPLPQGAAEEAGKKLHEIKSPTPGTYYGSASPDTEPFVKVGSRVQPDTVVCIIEAMKVFNEITADCSGTITAILMENQQPVEYGQVLFKVDPTG